MRWISHGVLFLGTRGPGSVFNLIIFLLAFQLLSVSSSSKGECLHLCTLSSPWVLRVAQIRMCPMVGEFSSGLRKANSSLLWLFSSSNLSWLEDSLLCLLHHHCSIMFLLPIQSCASPRKVRVQQQVVPCEQMSEIPKPYEWGNWTDVLWSYSAVLGDLVRRNKLCQLENSFCPFPVLHILDQHSPHGFLCSLFSTRVPAGCTGWAAEATVMSKSHS